MMRTLVALLTVLCGLIPSPVPAAIEGKRVTNRDIQALALAIEDEIYDEGCQGYGFDASVAVHNETYELPLYIKPAWNEQDLGWAIYKLLPVGEVLRMFSAEPDGTAIIYGHPEWNFPPTERSYRTVYMDDDELCRSKHEWIKGKIILDLNPSESRIREASQRQRKRMGERYHAHKRDCSFSWR